MSSAPKTHREPETEGALNHGARRGAPKRDSSRRPPACHTCASLHGCLSRHLVALAREAFPLDSSPMDRSGVSPSGEMLFEEKPIRLFPSQHSTLFFFSAHQPLYLNTKTVAYDPPVSSF